MFIENEGALFRGSSRQEPAEIWDRSREEWVAYEGEVPKLHVWGRTITEDEALALIEEDGVAPRNVGEAMELDPWKFDGYDGPRDYPRPGALAHLDLRARKKAEARAAEHAVASASTPDYGSYEEPS
jgi:hypothetical protein